MQPKAVGVTASISAGDAGNNLKELDSVHVGEDRGARVLGSARNVVPTTVGADFSIKQRKLV